VYGLTRRKVDETLQALIKGNGSKIAKEDLLDKIMSYGDAMTKEEVTESLRFLQGAKRDATYDEVL